MSLLPWRGGLLLPAPLAIPRLVAVPHVLTPAVPLERRGVLLAVVLGLLRASFIPPKPIRDLRELTRYGKALIRERASEVNRIQKLLESANIKLSSVASDVVGVSGRAMLEGFLRGQEDAHALADMARGTLRKKIP